ncbi:hypothetical protein JB92DRAFT_812364 [Gautieria morchelliformis]|nr:hypothetical protein JB92DRAFT_812364 [Gautieria morchelliformis]
MISHCHINTFSLYQSCTFWFQYTAYSAGAEHAIVGGILILRLYALFDCNRRLLTVLLTLYALSMEALRGIFGGCAPTNIPLWCWWYWIPSMIFESTLLCLALYKTCFSAIRCFILEVSHFLQWPTFSPGTSHRFRCTGCSSAAT